MAIDTAAVEEVIKQNIDTVLTQPLEETSKFLSLGSRVVPTATPVTFPKINASFSVARYGESEEIVENTTTSVFDTSLALMPSTMESYKGLIRLSNESVRQASIGLDSVLTDRLVRDFQVAIDTDGFATTGDGTTAPKGIFHADWAVPSIDITDGGVAQDLDFDTLHDAIGTLMGNDAPVEGIKWIMDPTTLVKLRKIKDLQDRYIVTPDVTVSPGGYMLLGVPVVVTKRLASATVGKYVALVNPSSMIVTRDQNPTVKVLTERYAEFDELGIRVTARYDWGFIEPDANVFIEGVA